jgi:hypothetical protein
VYHLDPCAYQEKKMLPKSKSNRFLSMIASLALIALFSSCSDPTKSGAVHLVSLGTTLQARVLTPPDVAGHTVTPLYYTYSSVSVGFLNYAKASSTNEIVENGNDVGAMEKFPTIESAADGNGFTQVFFKPDLESNIIDSVNGGLNLPAAKYSAIILERNWSGYWNVDSNASGMTDYPAFGWFASKAGFKDQRLSTDTYWKDGIGNGDTYNLNRINYIVLVDKALLHKYFLLNVVPGNGSAPIAYQVFNTDGSLRSDIYGFDQLTDTERELVSYIAVSTANPWGPDPNGLNFKNEWMKPDTPQPFSAFVFIPTDPVDLSDMASHQSTKIRITWDLTYVLYEEYNPAGDYSTEQGVDYPFMTDPNPWDSTNWYVKMGPDAGTGDSILETYYWAKRFQSSDGITYTPFMPGTTPTEPVYEKVPFLYEGDPIGGPMNWQVQVLYDE